MAWIDIGLVANARFVDALVHFLSLPALRESACDCVCEILAKGMDPADKARLVESLSLVLQRAGVLTVAEVGASPLFMRCSLGSSLTEHCVSS